MNDETKKNIIQMFGKIPEAMLIINNGIYCDAETDGMFYYKMGITDGLFSPERINDYIIRRPYPNKRVDQISKKIGRNVFKAGYPLLYNDASELNGRKYLAFDVWIGLGVHPKDLSTAPDACHIYVPLDIHATNDKPFVSFFSNFAKQQYCQTALNQRMKSYIQLNLDLDFMWKHMKLGKMDIYILHGGRHASTRLVAMLQPINCLRSTNL